MRNKKLPMKTFLLPGIVCLLILAGCGGSSSQVTNQSPPIRVSVTPSDATVIAGGVQQFTATVSPSGANQAVTWSVSGTGCMGPSCGTIDSTGKYTAPTGVPNPPTVTVTATSLADSSKSASASVTLVSNLNTPRIFDLSPRSTAVGGPAFTLTVSGSSFVSTSIVRWNGSDRPTAFFNSTQVTAQIVAADIAATGTAVITVFTPAPAGGTSNSVNFNIVNGQNPVSIALAADPSHKFGKFAYVANLGSNNVTIYTIDAATGMLAFTGTIAAGTGPTFVAVHPSGKFAYVVNQGSNDISMYTIDGTTGALKSIGPIAATSATRLTVDPSGRFAYVANSKLSYVSMYVIDATTGALTLAGTVPAGTNPSSVTVDPSGKFAYVANSRSNNVSMYTINPTTGTLEPAGTIAAGTSPVSVAIDPSGKFAYVTNCGDFLAVSGDVSMYTINPSTGTLSSIGTIGAGGCPFDLAVDPSGKFAYVIDGGNLNDSGVGVSMYAINASTGVLTSIGGIIDKGLDPSSVAIDPSGKFAYFTDQFSSSISMYAIDATTGALTLIGTIGT